MKKVRESLPLVGVFFFVAFGFFVRYYRLGNRFLTCETKNVLHGIRLHHLAFFNFDDHYTQNFFNFLFSTLGGIRYFTTYVASGIYEVIGVPVSDYWLVFPYVVLGTVNIALTYVLGAKIADRRVGLIGAGFTSVNASVIASSRWDNAEPTVTFTVLLVLLALWALGRRPTVTRSLALGLLLFVACCMESVMIAPLVGVLHLAVAWEAWKAAPRGQRIAATLRVVVPVWLMLAIVAAVQYHYYYTPYDLGLFRWMDFAYNDGRRATPTGFLATIGFLFDYFSKYYFSKWFLLLTFGAFFALLEFRRWKNLSAGTRLLSVGAGYSLVVFGLKPTLLEHHSHLYVIDPILLLFFAAVWVEASDAVWRFFMARSWPVPTGSAAAWALLVIGGLPFFAAHVRDDMRETLGRPILVHPLKTVGYYVRGYAGADTTVFNLANCRDQVCLNYFSEIFYGRQYRVLTDEYPRQIFCLGTAPIDEVLNAYKLTRASFYVNIGRHLLEYPDGRREITEVENDASKARLADLVAKGAQQVAVVRYKDEVLAEIYSFERYPFQDLDVRQYDPLWDRKYAHLDTLLNTPWAGLVSTLGEKFDTARGY